jgi:hypothetical protein
MTQFFNEFGNSARQHFANVRFTQIHIKGVLTESLSAFGSYNLTYPAKHASWETITLKNTTATDIEFFDNLWASCRPMQEAEPNVLALAESPFVCRPIQDSRQIGHGRVLGTAFLTSAGVPTLPPVEFHHSSP